MTLKSRAFFIERHKQVLVFWWPHSTLSVARKEKMGGKKTVGEKGVWKTHGKPTHVSNPSECGQETVKMGQWAGNASSKICQPPPTPLPCRTHPLVMPGIPRPLFEKSKQPGSKKNRLGRAAAMCRASACQAHFWARRERHKHEQPGLWVSPRCDQGGFRSRQDRTMTMFGYRGALLQ